MSRSIEEVPLYVPIGRHTLGVTQIEEAKEGQPSQPVRVPDVDDEAIIEEQMHEFSISETPLTMPQTNRDADMVVVALIVPIIRLRSPASGAKDKGKKQIVAEEDSDSDSDSDDDMVVHVLRPSVEDTLEKGRPVRRKLIFGIPGITDNVVEGGEDETDSSGESMEATSTEEGRDAPPVYNDREASGRD
ncbi:hypothetical protein F2Q69_00019083 [Brassica cretica]|uniref:Uncharacterized protein n=1 Tax=Brassica cretica TaxID=69181 RepID=A0A8S9PY93_BRACR|nr:hypothetical protein F2Q69_00019083 [Brassica cretica]